MTTILTGIAAGQASNTGEIKGTVQDTTGASVAGVTVTVTNVETHVAVTITTNSDGLYDAPSLLPGQYSLTFEKAGFKQFVRQGITLRIQTLQIDTALQIGSANESVTVTSAASLIETESSAQTITLDSKAVEDAPIVGTVWSTITEVLPGVNGGGYGQNATGASVGINGTQGNAGVWLIEGAVATSPTSYNSSDNFPPIDAIQEVSANLSNFGAQYGNGVAAFNVILKSGTNHYHGSAYEFAQSNVFNARNYFATTTPELLSNIYGGSVGGFILKNRLFGFFNFQNNPSTSPFTSTYTFPTDAMRSGDFSALLSLPTPVQLYDPNTTVYDSTGKPVSRTPYVNNQIPASELDPVSLNILQYIPRAQDQNSPLGTNYTASLTGKDTARWYVGKIDYDISTANRLSVSGMYYPLFINQPDPRCPMNCNAASPNSNLATQITDVWTLSPNLLNETRISTVRESDIYNPPDLNKGLVEKIGLKNAPADIFPIIQIGGLPGGTGIGTGTHAALIEGVYSGSDVATLIHGRHTLKMGGEYDKSYQNYGGWGDINAGTFSFSGIATENPANIKAGPGFSYADFLVGGVNSWSVAESPEVGGRAWTTQLFFQDDYKVRPNVTLNIGMRYGIQSGWGEEHKRFGTFDPALINPATQTPGAMVYGGENGRNTIQDNVYKLFAPRLGFAWIPANKWSVRVSYGIMHPGRSSNVYANNALGIGLNAVGSKVSTDSVTPVFRLQDGPPSPVYPTQATLTPQLFNGQSVPYFPKKEPLQYVEEVYADVQHEIQDGILIDVAYVFTKGTHLGFPRDFNQVTVLGSGVRPYPQYQSINAALFDGWSNYNALQLRTEKRLVSQGITFAINYSFSKTMDAETVQGGNGGGSDVYQDAYQPARNYGLSQLDLTHLFNGQFTYQVPFGKDRKFLNQSSILDAVLGGWRVSTIFQLHSGTPFTAVMANNQSGALSGSQFPNRVGNPTPAHRTLAEYFDPSAFASPGMNQFGDAGRNILRGPGWQDVDLGIGKVFDLHWEQTSLEVRADAFDVLNHPNFGQPSNSIGAGSSGGRISSANTSRGIQLGTRFKF
ncbi:MAG TPA: TonB-dependent receptor [Acidobacteriaceae bacterium]